MQQIPCMGQADLHMHTNLSDGKPTVTELLDFVAQHRPYLNAIAITDHDTLDASLWAYEQREHYAFDIIPGVEVSSRDGHVIALWVTSSIKQNMNLADTVAAIHELGGIAVLAHPIHPFLAEHIEQALRIIRNPQVLVESGVDAVETHNAGICGTGCNWLAAWFAHNMGLAVTSGSDAHTLGAIGTGRTLFYGSTAEDLRTALQTRQTTVRGSAWSMTDYIAYFKHERQRTAMTSSDTTNLLPQTNRSVLRG
jgi:predicted metal-dependent phosphoesterase TrpH